MNFYPVKYVNETLSRGKKFTLILFLRLLIGRYLTQSFLPNQRSGKVKKSKLIFRHVTRSHLYTSLDQSSYPRVLSKYYFMSFYGRNPI